VANAENVPGKIGKASSAGYTHGKAAQTSAKVQVEWLHPRHALVPSLCRVSSVIKDCCCPWDISSPPRAAGPRPSRRKSGCGNELLLRNKL